LKTTPFHLHQYPGYKQIGKTISIKDIKARGPQAMVLAYDEVAFSVQPIQEAPAVSLQVESSQRSSFLRGHCEIARLSKEIKAPGQSLLRLGSSQEGSSSLHDGCCNRPPFEGNKQALGWALDSIATTIAFVRAGAFLATLAKIAKDEECQAEKLPGESKLPDCNEKVYGLKPSSPVHLCYSLGTRGCYFHALGRRY
jgi:hypothetical protein